MVHETLTVRGPLTERRANMVTGWGDREHDDRIRAGAMGVACRPSNRPIGCVDRRLDDRAGGIHAVFDPARLGFSEGGGYRGGSTTRRRSRAEFKWEMSVYEPLALQTPR